MKVHIRLFKKNKIHTYGNLRLECHTNGIRFRKFLGINISERNWNKNRQRLKSSSSNAFDINKRLVLIISVVNKIYYELINDDIPICTSILNEKFDEKINGLKKRTTFFDYSYEFIENSRNSKTKGTCDGYVHLVNCLKTFEKHNRRKIDWNTFDYRFYNDYQNYQYKIKENAPNHFGKRIAQIKAILNSATKLGLNKFLMYKDYVVVKKRVKKQYLNEEELMMLWNLNLSNKLRLERVRDIFLVCAFTGVRFAEYKHLKKENLELGNNGVSIGYYAKKNNKYVRTLCNEISFSILKKYEFELPTISEQKYNEYIKEICKIAKIDNEIIIHTFKAGQSITLKKRKYEEITTHTARRSYITNLHKKGISSLLIMKTTGHSQENMINRYVQTTTTESVDLINIALKNQNKEGRKVG